MTHTYNPSTWEVKSGKSGVQGHPQVHNEFKASLSYRRPGLRIQTNWTEIIVIHNLTPKKKKKNWFFCRFFFLRVLKISKRLHPLISLSGSLKGANKHKRQKLPCRESKEVYLWVAVLFSLGVPRFLHSEVTLPCKQPRKVSRMRGLAVKKYVTLGTT